VAGHGSEFTPLLAFPPEVRLGQTRLDGFNDRIIRLCKSRGLTMSRRKGGSRKDTRWPAPQWRPGGYPPRSYYGGPSAAPTAALPSALTGPDRHHHGILVELDASTTVRSSPISRCHSLPEITPFPSASEIQPGAARGRNCDQLTAAPNQLGSWLSRSC
jgi:hypothetical protein